MAATARMEETYKPWGYFRVLADEKDYKVKAIVVYPDKRGSYQRHERRSEHWYVVNGRGLATVDDKDLPLDAGQNLDIPLGSWHRMANPGHENLLFVEVQTGDYFGEDDIKRKEDDFGRV